MSNRQLNEKQQRFLEVLFEEAEGDFVKAKKLAGYSESYSTKTITDTLAEEIFELTKKYISTLGVKAAYAMKQVLDHPTELGNRDKMAAAKDILDRANFKSSDKVEIKSESPLFILPEKRKDDD
jgi:hypothetical protein